MVQGTALGVEEELLAQRHGRTLRSLLGTARQTLSSLCETSSVKNEYLLQLLSGQQLPLGERTDMAQAGEELRQRIFVLALRSAGGAGDADPTESASQLSRSPGEGLGASERAWASNSSPSMLRAYR